MVDNLLEWVLVDLILFIEQTIHLIDNIFREVDNSPDDIKEVVENLQSATDLEFHLAGAAVFVYHIFEDESWFSE